MSTDDRPPPEAVSAAAPSWREKFVTFVNEKVPNSAICRECGQKSVIVSDEIVCTPIFKNGGMQIGGPTFTYAMLVCTNCGNTRFFNAVVAQVVDGSKSV